jgi:tRNA threonylcarbamoyl adenosine modification protein YeaZ
VLILGLDTSTPSCTVALAEVADPASSDVVGRAAAAVVDARRHGELLTPLIAQVLDEAGATVRDLDAVVCGLGPGPYTSLRVGIVTAAALADAAGIPAYGVCSLDGVGPLPSGPVTVATDARRREVYVARYRDGVRTQGPDVLAPAPAADALEPGERVVGAGGELYAEVFGAANDADGPAFPDALRIIGRAAADGLFGRSAVPLEPLYLRRPDATPRTAA